MTTQEITLRNESGETISKTFTDMQIAAEWCAEYPEYGITLEINNDGECWDAMEWQKALDIAFS